MIVNEDQKLYFNCIFIKEQKRMEIAIKEFIKLQNERVNEVELNNDIKFIMNNLEELKKAGQMQQPPSPPQSLLPLPSPQSPLPSPPQSPLPSPTQSSDQDNFIYSEISDVWAYKDPNWFEAFEFSNCVDTNDFGWLNY